MTEMSPPFSKVILYSVQFEKELGDAVVDKIARAVVEEPVLGLTPEEEYAAISEDLRSGAQLTASLSGPDGQQHGEGEFRDFLRRVLARLDAMRPWPVLPFRPLDVSRWEDFAHAQPIARIGFGYVDIQARLHRGFSRAGDPEREVLVLQLKSGDEIALVSPWWPASNDTALLRRDPGRRPQDVLAAFLDATPFTADDVTPL